jgi:L-aspartate oxidase
VNSCDVLVVGAGLAGSIAALSAADEGSQVCLVGYSSSASRWAQGGIVTLGAGGEDSLVQDVLQAGCFKNNRAAVRLLASKAQPMIRTWLMDRLGVPFDRLVNGELDLGLEAAHSEARVLHVKDRSGAAILEKVHAAVEAHPRIRWIQHGHLVDLLLSHVHDEDREASFREASVRGAYFLMGSQVEAITARSVVLATGGFSQLYLHSTGPQHSRGEGLAAAHRAGARSLHLEYVQFHPTALYAPGHPRVLLTEALRGAGAKLLSIHKESFVDELSARDLVARAIHEEMLASGSDHVWLDARAVPGMADRFPGFVHVASQVGLDPHRDLIPVVPAAHFTNGGVWSDLQGASSVPGLYVAGELACTGLHGANRLASTALLEALVFGGIAGTNAAAFSQDVEENFKPRPWRHEKRDPDPALISQDWTLLKQTLWNYVGLVRSEHRLKRAEKSLVQLRTEVEAFYKRSRLTPDLLGLRAGVLVATLVLYAALRNHESVGAHYLKSSY